MRRQEEYDRIFGEDFENPACDLLVTSMTSLVSGTESASAAYSEKGLLPKEFEIPGENLKLGEEILK